MVAQEVPGTTTQLRGKRKPTDLTPKSTDGPSLSVALKLLPSLTHRLAVEVRQRFRDSFDSGADLLSVFDLAGNRCADGKIPPISLERTDRIGLPVASPDCAKFFGAECDGMSRVNSGTHGLCGNIRETCRETVDLCLDYMWHGARVLTCKAVSPPRRCDVARRYEERSQVRDFRSDQIGEGGHRQALIGIETMGSHFQPAYLSPVCRRCVYRLRLVHDRCPETAATCGMLSPVSKRREMPSWRRSWK